MDISYNGKLTGDARFNWNAACEEHDIALELPLSAAWVASYPDTDDSLDPADVAIVQVRIVRDGCWSPLEAALLKELTDNYRVRGEIADWINANYVDLMASDGYDAAEARGVA